MRDPMRLKTFLYFADFVFYPLASAALVAVAFAAVQPPPAKDPDDSPT